MAALITYIGKEGGPRSTTLWGLPFERGVPTPCDDEKAISMARDNPHFDVSEGEAPKAEPVATEAVEPEEAPEPTDMPDIPEDWADQHHFKRIKWAKQVRPDLAEAITTGADADEILSEYMAGR